MKASTKVFEGMGFTILLTAFFASSAWSQADTTRLQAKSTLVATLSGGFITDVHFLGTGGVLDLTLRNDKTLFGASYTSEGTGNVVTYLQGGFLLGGAAQTSYAADLHQVIAFHYGRQISNIISVTGGLAWVTHSTRSAINGHNDQGWFSDYHADLVEQVDAYPAIPLTIKSTFKIASWCCLELHAQANIGLNETWLDAGMSVGLGNLDAQ
jgi:hypothetical protein